MRRRKTEVESTHGGARVEVVLFKGATRLCTHRAGDGMPSELISGAIVKLVPGAEWTAEAREAERRLILDMGALHVWVAPRPAARRAVARERRPKAGLAEAPRALVERMVDEAHTRDRDKLRAVVEAALARAGL